MRTKDRLFIFLMVLLICLFGLFAMHEFAKNRNLNGINVTGSAEAYVPSDWAVVTLELYATGDTYDKRNILIKERVDQIKEIFTGYKLNNGEGGYEQYEDEGCYVKNRRLGVVCIKQYISFEMTGDIETQAKDIQGQLEGYDWANIQSWNLAVQENGQSVNEIRALANENAKQKAEQLANSLGVKLGKLIVYSENGFDGNMYYNSLQNRVYYSSSLSSFNINVKATVYHTYSIK